MLRHTLAALLFLAVSLGIGVVGYHFTENLPWSDSLLSTPMILGGVVPICPLQTDGGKVIITIVALFYGIAFKMVTGIIVAPISNRLLHGTHLETDEK